MPRPEDDHSVSREPHLQPRPASSDPSETRAEETLRREAERTPEAHAVGQSIYDEPDVLPGRPPEVVEQDWSCSKCGYNLRGLPTGHPCPECGHKELYRPAAPGAAGYQGWLQRRVAETSSRKAWNVALLVALCGGPLAALAALFHIGPGMLLASNLFIAAIVFGPAVEEAMKIGVASFVVETRPYLFRRVEQLQLATVGTALLFAVIENVVYLYVYHPNHTVECAVWRWTVCVALHVGCTLVATRGLAAVWQQAVTEYRPPKLAQGVRWLVVAIVLHGSYNAAALMYEFLK